MQNKQKTKKSPNQPTKKENKNQPNQKQPQPNMNTIKKATTTNSPTPLPLACIWTFMNLFGKTMDTTLCYQPMTLNQDHRAARNQLSKSTELYIRKKLCNVDFHSRLKLYQKVKTCALISCIFFGRLGWKLVWCCDLLLKPILDSFRPISIQIFKRNKLLLATLWTVSLTMAYVPTHIHQYLLNLMWWQTPLNFTVWYQSERQWVYSRSPGYKKSRNSATILL